MAAIVLDGREAARAVTAEVRETVERLGFSPQLVFVRAGDDPASASYVRLKAKLAQRAGVRSHTEVLDENVRQEDLMELVSRLNDDTDVDGILVQLPLYPHLDSGPLLDAIDPSKDVDGFHPVNVGRLWSGQPGLFPATPTGLIRILDHFGISIDGRRVVIVGRSNLVGKPAAALFLRRNATVTIAHSRTGDLPDVTRGADILVAAAGRPRIITQEMVKPGATVLDVGQTQLEGKLRGDVDPQVAGVAGALTPTPGGTGPMTVAMVIGNTLTAALQRRKTVENRVESMARPRGEHG
ncbi:MAG: tetrahydrofolate dehydrogenase/cyclohydrolase catalytic domain-containing protein [Trueperaceae bacterium]